MRDKKERKLTNLTISIPPEVLEKFKKRFPYVNISAWVKMKIEKALATDELELG